MREVKASLANSAQPRKHIEDIWEHHFVELNVDTFHIAMFWFTSRTLEHRKEAHVCALMGLVL